MISSEAHLKAVQAVVQKEDSDVQHRASACTGTLLQSNSDIEVVLVDALRKMLDKAELGVSKELSGSESFQSASVVYSDIFSTSDMQKLVRRHDVNGASLITAQRVMLTVRKDRRAQQLPDWTALLRTGGKLILDVPHPKSRVGATFVGNGRVDPRVDKSNPLQACRVIADEETWEECRTYA